MEIALVLDLRPESSVPLNQQVYEQIRAAVLSGRVRSQQKLPSSRQLAQFLGVSRTTVVQSYDQLISEGYLETRQGAGTFVCTQLPDTLLSSRPFYSAQSDSSSVTALKAVRNDPKSPMLHENAVGTEQGIEQGIEHSTADAIGAAQSKANTTEAADATAFALSTYGQRLFKAATPPERTSGPLSFRYWRPDLAAFPVKQWQRLVNRCAAADNSWMTYSSEPLGYAPLRQEIAAYIAQVRAVNCTPEQILITQGTQQAIGLIAQVLLDEGDAIAIEDPGYLSARKVFSAHGAVTFPISVDSEGLNVAQLEQLSANTAPIKLTYVTPSHQFPTGVLMSLPRRLALLDWARRTGSLIVEDDYDSEFRYSGRPIPALQGLDGYGRVLYVGTFSKVMFPGLRMGYIVVPPALLPAFRRAKWVCDRQGNLLHQAALTEFIAEGHLAKHVRRMRNLYENKRKLLINSLQNISSPVGGIEVLGDLAGLHFMARLPLSALSLSAPQLIAQAKTQGVQLFDTAPYYHPKVSGDSPSSAAQPLTNGQSPQKITEQNATNSEFIFGFGGLSETAIEQATERLQPLFVRQ